MREERIRKEHVGRETANRDGVPCSHEEMYNYVQQEIARHQAEAAAYCLHPDQQEESAADQELVSRWHANQALGKIADAEKIQADWQHFRDASK